MSILNASSIEDLFGNYDSVVLLYEREPKNGHWVGLIRNGNVIEFLILTEYFQI